MHLEVIYWVALNAILFWVNGPVEGCELLRSLNWTQMIPVVEVDGCNAMGNNYYLMVRIELRNYINISSHSCVLEMEQGIKFNSLYPPMMVSCSDDYIPTRLDNSLICCCCGDVLHYLHINITLYDGSVCLFLCPS